MWYRVDSCPIRDREAFTLIAIVAIALLNACASHSRSCPILSDANQLDAHVGEIVILHGIVTNTKIPTIIGVDVASVDPDLRGQPAEATGLLLRWVVTPSDLQMAQDHPGLTTADRGPGVFYRLADPHSNEAVPVRPLSRDR